MALGFLALPALLAGEEQPQAAANPVPAREEIKVLIERLGEGGYDARSEAMQCLRALGEQARPFLETACKGGDPEITHAAKVLLKRINKAQIEVKIVDLVGKPVPDAEVLVNLNRRQNSTLLGNNWQNLNAKTNREGVATFGDLEPDVYHLNLACRSEGYLHCNKIEQNQRLAVGKNEFSLSCRRGNILKGKLLAADNSPLAQCKVVIFNATYLRYKDKPNQIFEKKIKGMETDQDGAFSFNALSDFEYAIAVLADGKVLYCGKPIKLAGERTEDLGPLVTDIKPGALAESHKQAAPQAQEPGALKALVEIQPVLVQPVLVQPARSGK